MTSHLKKVELHCHLEGAAPPTLTLAQARKYNIDISSVPDRWCLCSGTISQAFCECYDKVSEVYKTEEDHALLTETYLEELAAIRHDLQRADRVSRSWQADRAWRGRLHRGRLRGNSSREGEKRYRGTSDRHGERHFGPESVIGAAEYAAKAKIHLSPDSILPARSEWVGLPTTRVPLTSRAMRGWASPSTRARYAAPSALPRRSTSSAPSRIGHGVRAIEDMDLVRRIADLGTVLEVCPGSNIALNVFPDFASHPLRTAQGGRCTRDDQFRTTRRSFIRR